MQPDVGPVQAPPVPTMSYLAAAARANAGLAPTTGVSQTTGVGSTHNVVDLKDEDNETVPMMDKEEDVIVEYVTGKEGEEETAQDKNVKYPGPAYGRGMRIRTKPLSYEPVMTGKTYKQGVNNFCCRGVRYTLDEVLPSG